MNTGSVLAQFTISLSMAVNEPVSVDWHTTDGSAKAGVDYAANSGTVIFAPGQIAKTVDILVYGRAVGTEDRTFYVEMLPPTNAILGASIGQCVIHVDTTGSQPVTEIIIPTGPRGIQGKSAYQTWLDLGNTGTEQDFINSLKPNAEDIADDVLPLLNVGTAAITSSGTGNLGKPDNTTVADVARRVAYASPAKVSTVVLAAGDNTLTPADLSGATIDFLASGFMPRVLHNGVLSEPNWGIDLTGKLVIKGATAGDVLYAVQYDTASVKYPLARRAEVVSLSDRLDGRINEFSSDAAGKGDSLLSVKQSLTGAVSRTQHDKNADVVSVKDFGAKGDGVTDDSAAFIAALAAASKVIVPWTPNGYVVSNITVDSGKRINGESRVKLKSTGNTVFNLTAFSPYVPCEVSGFHFDMTGAPASSVAIVLKTSLATVYNARISDVTFSNCYGAIHDETPKNSTTWTHDLEVRNMNCVFTKGTQIHMRQSNGFILFDSVKIDNTLNSSQITWSSALFESIAGLELTRFDVLGCGTATPTYDATQFAIRILGAAGLNASVWFNRVLVDFTRGLGVYIAGVYNVVSDQLGVHLTLGEAITLDGVTFSRFSNTSVFGARTNPNAPPAAAGIRLNNSNDNVFNNVMVKDVTGHGIVLKNSIRNILSNITSTNNVANGYAEDGACDFNIKNGCIYFNNGGNSMNQIGAGSATLNMVKTNGQFVASTLGTAAVA